MKKWTKEEKTRILHAKDREELEELHTKIAASPWRAVYHIQPVTGLLNDPNGFARYKGKWHLFYQWFPFGAVHGTKHWYHVSSEDLLHWKNEGLGFRPDRAYDNRGVYSGSAIEKDGYLYFVYTGNHREPDERRIPYQMAAAMDEKNRTGKMREPIIRPAEGYTEHQRDPKIFRAQGKYWILLGAQNNAKEGKFLLYCSDQLADGWELKGEMKVRGYESFGYMVECPDIEKIGDRDVLIFSPQGIDRREGFENANNAVYMIGQLDLDHLEFVPETPMMPLDRGFDFYAPQCAYDPDALDYRILEAWMGVSDSTYPATDEEGWEGLLTMPRRLTIENGWLMQRPAIDVDALKGNLRFEAKKGSIVRDDLHGRTPRTGIIEVDNPNAEVFSLTLFGRPLKKGFEITYDKLRQNLQIDRGDLNNNCNPRYGTIRRVHLDHGLRSLQIFIDRSSIEIFINDGEYVMTSRIFPDPEEHLLRMSGKNISLRIYDANRTVNDDFVL